VAGLLDDTGYTRATVLPYRTNDATGEQEFALPGLLASPMQAWVRALDAARAGRQVDPIDALEVAGAGVTGGLLAPVRAGRGVVMGAGPVRPFYNSVPASSIGEEAVTRARSIQPSDYGVGPEVSSKIASMYYGGGYQSGPNPKKLARGLLGPEAPPEEVAAAARLAADIRKLKADRFNDRPPNIDPLQFARDFKRPLALKEAKVKSELGSVPWMSELPEHARKRAVSQEVLGFDSSRTIARGYLDTLQAMLEKSGWSVRHASEDAAGNVTSRYMISPDGARQVRLSDHEVPLRNMDMQNWDGFSTGRWKGEQFIVFPDSVLDSISPSEAVAVILKGMK
jgi:hypothetical protein